MIRESWVGFLDTGAAEASRLGASVLSHSPARRHGNHHHPSPASHGQKGRTAHLVTWAAAVSDFVAESASVTQPFLLRLIAKMVSTTGVLRGQDDFFCPRSLSLPLCGHAHSASSEEEGLLG